MRRTAMAAGIVALVVVGVVWALAGHHGGSPAPFGTVQNLVSNLGAHLPKHLPDLGTCVNGDIGWLYSLDDALANSAKGDISARWDSYS